MNIFLQNLHSFISSNYPMIAKPALTSQSIFSFYYSWLTGLNDIFDAGTFGEKTIRRIKLSKMKEKLDNKSWTSRIKNKIKNVNKADNVSRITNIEKERFEIINMLGL